MKRQASKVTTMEPVESKSAPAVTGKTHDQLWELLQQLTVVEAALHGIASIAEDSEIEPAHVWATCQLLSSIRMDLHQVTGSPTPEEEREALDRIKAGA